MSGLGNVVHVFHCCIIVNIATIWWPWEIQMFASCRYRVALLCVAKIIAIRPIIKKLDRGAQCPPPLAWESKNSLGLLGLNIISKNKNSLKKAAFGASFFPLIHVAIGFYQWIWYRCCGLTSSLLSKSILNVKVYSAPFHKAL